MVPFLAHPEGYTMIAVYCGRMLLLLMMMMMIAFQWKSISKLRSVTCRMGSHSVTCHPTQVDSPCLNPSQTGWYSICLPRRDGKLS